jgi:hypothetical protein
MCKTKKQGVIALALFAAGLPALIIAGQDAPADKNLQYFKGKVVPLAALLTKQGAKLDADAEPYWLALQTDDGKIMPLVKDAGSRMFFKDAKLLNRPTRLTAKQIPNSQLLQVINVHSIVEGKLHDVYYWCDICTIKGFEAGPCDCCGAPYEFREVPIK